MITAQNGIFKLDTAHTSYIFRITPQGHLEHIHYGPWLPQADADALAQKHTIAGDYKNLDGLNYLEGRTLDEVDEQAYLGTVDAHVDGGVSVITMDIGELTEATLGQLFYFFQLSCGISAYVLGVNPFNQPGVEFYKRNMFRLLGKPGYEKKA